MLASMIGAIAWIATGHDGIMDVPVIGGLSKTALIIAALVAIPSAFEPLVCPQHFLAPAAACAMTRAMQPFVVGREISISSDFNRNSERLSAPGVHVHTWMRRANVFLACMAMEISQML
jgi:hypothetical protein